MNPHMRMASLRRSEMEGNVSKKSLGSFGGSFSSQKRKSFVWNEDTELYEEGSKRSLRQSLDYFLATSRFGMLMDISNAVFSTASCIVYVALTDTQLEHSNPLVSSFEIVFGIVFTFDYLVRLCAARKPFQFLCQWQSMVDLVTCLPVVFQLVTVQYDLSTLTLGTLVNFLRVLRVLRSARLTRLFSFSDSEIKQQIYSMILTLIIMVYLSAGILHLVENIREWWPRDLIYYDRTFMDMIYLIVTTITTVGYGDIHPVTTPGRVVVMIILITALVLAPKQTNQLIALMAMTSVYGRQSYKYNRHTHHVIVCGAINSGGVVEFFTELFHPDHGNINLHAVVIGSGPPSADMHALLSDPRYAFALTYLDGNVMNEKDLKRASAQYAKGIFMLTNKYSRNVDEDDASAILRLLSIKRFISLENKSNDVFTSVQLLNPESQKLLMTSVEGKGKRQRKNNHIVCVHEIKMNMLAKSCICPGMSTMICNLISSSGDEPHNKSEGEWAHQYSQGCGYEIYHVKLSSSFEGLSFAEAAKLVFSVSGTILFALEINHFAAESRVVLNPGRMVIPNVEEFGIYGFVIAEDSEQASVVSTTRGEPKLGQRKKDLRRMISHSQAQIDAETRLVSEIEQLKMGRSSKFSKLGYSSGEIQSKPGLWANTKNLLKQQIHGNLLYEMKEMYYLADQPVPVEDAILGSVDDHYPESWGGHIVVIGDVANLYHFILPLRSRHLSCAVPIVILFPTLPTAGTWSKLSVFKDVFFVQGSPLEVGDLRRAKAHTAARAVIFAKEYDNDEDSDSALVDADTIFAYSILSSMNKSIEVIGEIVTPSNIAFLHDRQRRSRRIMDYHNSPPFAAGRVYTSSMIDTLVCQAYYNPHIITILHHLVAGEDRELVTRWQKKMQTHLTSPVKDSHLYSCRVPSEYWDKTYAELFHYFVDNAIVPLGIRRGTETDMLGNTVPFVYTAPTGDTVLRSTDTVFILSEKPPKLDSASEMNQGTNIGRAKQEFEESGSPNANGSSHNLVEDFDERDASMSEIENQVAKFATAEGMIGSDTEVLKAVEDLSKNIHSQLDNIQHEMTGLVQRIARIERKNKIRRASTTQK